MGMQCGLDQNELMFYVGKYAARESILRSGLAEFVYTKKLKKKVKKVTKKLNMKKILMPKILSKENRNKNKRNKLGLS